MKSTLLAAGCVLLLGGGWYWHQHEELSATAVSCTDILHICSSGPLQIRFDRRPHPMQPFMLTARLPHATEIQASFAMQGMQMGFNRYRLLAQPDGAWQADVTLPVCIQGRSDWEMLLEADTAAGIERYRLLFEADSR